MEPTAGLDPDGPRWSLDVHQADWIGPRLTSWDDDGLRATAVVPAGFAAYARVLHAAGTAGDDDRPVRWAEVAAWSGLPLRPDAQFHSVALPPADPGEPYPFHGQVPEEGNLGEPDTAVLAGLVRDWTATPEDCWFGVWDGYGWGPGVALVAVIDSGEAGPPPGAVRTPWHDPVPAPVRAGPRVELPNRGYLLYQGPAEAALALPRLDATDGQCPNLWWPADRAWCVASEIDLPWTYVGGPRGLIDAILADDRIEALPAAPDDPVNRVEDWVASWAAQLVQDVLAHGTASLSTPRGTVEARLRRPARLRRGELRIEVTARDGGSSSSWSAIGGDEERVRRSVDLYLTQAVLDLTH
jgi:hypothetical protein